MCDCEYESSETSSHGYSTGRSRSYSPSRRESSTPGDKSDTKTGAPPAYRTDPLDMEIYRLKILLQDAIKEMSVTRFVELRRKYDRVWSEVLDEL